jgi:hypothetical protein
MAGIQYISNKHINRALWDKCINTSANGLLYAQSVYLDAMATNWDALVLGNYEAVMPLTWRKKYGINYLYQPAFTASLGVFAPVLSASLFNSFIAAIPPFFRYADIYLNHQNIYYVAGCNCYQRSNYVLNLQPPYADIAMGYRQNIKRNIARATKLQCNFTRLLQPEDVIALARQFTPTQRPLPSSDYNQFLKLYHLLAQRGQAAVYGVKSAGGQLLSSAIFFNDQQRLYYILPGNHPNSKTMGASHYLINEVIRLHAGTPLLLDFEGSDIKSLAFFYSSFGAQHQPYGALQFNRLPALLKWLKS